MKNLRGERVQGETCKEKDTERVFFFFFRAYRATELPSFYSIACHFSLLRIPTIIKGILDTGTQVKPGGGEEVMKGRHVNLRNGGGEQHNQEKVHPPFLPSLFVCVTLDRM